MMKPKWDTFTAWINTSIQDNKFGLVLSRKSQSYLMQLLSKYITLTRKIFDFWLTRLQFLGDHVLVTSAEAIQGELVQIYNLWCARARHGAAGGMRQPWCVTASSSRDSSPLKHSTANRALDSWRVPQCATGVERIDNSAAKEDRSKENQPYEQKFQLIF